MPSIAQRFRDLFGRQVMHISIEPEANPYVEGLSARKLYATQANLHAVVSFLSDSVAQLPIKVYIRNAETDRQRDRESIAAKLLRHPNSDQTTYELTNALVTELLLMGNVYLWVLPDSESASGYQLRIIPKDWVMDSEQTTAYAPDSIRVTVGNGSYIDIPKSEFVQFRLYNPGNPGGYQSPISALKQTLTEQVNADKFRTEVWTSSGRFNAYITRPANVQPWDEQSRERFAKAFRESWGKGGANTGKMPLLEDGMEIKPYQFNAKEAQYAETKQLSREDVAAAYHINPSLIWHTTTQTYASAKDNARALYSDCLGPILQMLQQRINSFLLPMVGASENTYIEFDLTEKLKGSFEERASILQSSVGGPWLTRNEARADNNLPPIEGGDDLIVPLNVIAGGQASPTDTHMGQFSAEPEVKKAEPMRIKGLSDKEEDEKVASTLEKFFKRQASSVLPKLGAKAAEWWDEDRWDDELSEDLEPIIDEIADKHGMTTAEVLGTKYGREQTRKYLKKLSKSRAHAINTATYEKLIADDVDPASVYENRKADSGKLGRHIALAVAGWGMLEACTQAKQQGFERTIEKEWVTGPNPRPSHAAMDGERVGIDDVFSNGLSWPGAFDGTPEETCGCNCTTDVIITEG